MIFFYILVSVDHGDFYLSNQQTEELNKEFSKWEIVSIESLPKEPMRPETVKFWIRAATD